MRATCLALTVLLACSACRQARDARDTGRPTVTKIELVVRPRDGYAHCEFAPDGSVSGGHHSGGPKIFVHMDKRHLPPEKVKEIWQAAESLGKDIYGKDVPPQAEWKGSVKLLISLKDRPTARLSWPFDGQYPDAGVQSLVKLLYENKTGGW